MGAHGKQRWVISDWSLFFVRFFPLCNPRSLFACGSWIALMEPCLSFVSWWLHIPVAGSSGHGAYSGQQVPSTGDHASLCLEPPMAPRHLQGRGPASSTTSKIWRTLQHLFSVSLVIHLSLWLAAHPTPSHASAFMFMRCPLSGTTCRYSPLCK